MPILKTHGLVLYYAHVPKCAGSAVADYLKARCGPLAFYDNRYKKQPVQDRWTRSSPQHIDRAALLRLFPDGFFDASFTIVRHPVARLVSAYHFQTEVEGAIPDAMAFSDWLVGLEAAQAKTPFLHDNHVRAMDEIVPDAAEIFRLEDGIDALVGWLDAVTGVVEGPRQIPSVNERGAYRRVGTRPRAEPTAEDIAWIAERYAVDFERFGYHPERAAPTRPAKQPANRSTGALQRLRKRFGL